MQKSHISLVGGLFELVGERCLCTTRNHTTTTLLYTLRLTKLMEHGSLYHSTHSHGSRTGGMICGRNDLLETISGNECVVRYASKHFLLLACNLDCYLRLQVQN